VNSSNIEKNGRSIQSIQRSIVQILLRCFPDFFGPELFWERDRKICPPFISAADSTLNFLEARIITDGIKLGPRLDLHQISLSI